MLVKDLIKELEKLDGELEVLVKDSNGDDSKVLSVTLKETYKGFQEKKVVKIC